MYVQYHQASCSIDFCGDTSAELPIAFYCAHVNSSHCHVLSVAEVRSPPFLSKPAVLGVCIMLTAHPDVMPKTLIMSS